VKSLIYEKNDTVIVDAELLRADFVSITNSDEQDQNYEHEDYSADSNACDSSCTKTKTEQLVGVFTA